MQNNWKWSTGGLLLAGIAAYAWYRYTHMSENEKSEMMGDLKERGRKWFDHYVPDRVKDMMGHHEQGQHGRSFGDAPEYMA